MAKADFLKKEITDQLDHIEDETFLSFLDEIISSYSEYGRTISQEDLQKKISKLDIKSKKIELIHLVLRTEKAAILEKVRSFLTESDDWWDDLSDEEKKDIELGLQDVENGNVVDYEEVKKLFRK